MKRKSTQERRDAGIRRNAGIRQRISTNTCPQVYSEEGHRNWQIPPRDLLMYTNPHFEEGRRNWQILPRDLPMVGSPSRLHRDLRVVSPERPPTNENNDHDGGNHDSHQDRTLNSPQRERQPLRNDGQTMRSIFFAVAVFAFGFFRLFNPSAIPNIGNSLNLFLIK